MTVNELITQLDLMPADAEVRGVFEDGPIGHMELHNANLTEDGGVVLLDFA